MDRYSHEENIREAIEYCRVYHQRDTAEKTCRMISMNENAILIWG